MSFSLEIPLWISLSIFPVKLILLETISVYVTCIFEFCYRSTLITLAFEHEIFEAREDALLDFFFFFLITNFLLMQMLKNHQQKISYFVNFFMLHSHNYYIFITSIIIKLYNYINGKLRLTHMWLNQNLSCLPVV